MSELCELLGRDEILDLCPRDLPAMIFLPGGVSVHQTRKQDEDSGGGGRRKQRQLDGSVLRKLGDSVDFGNAERSRRGEGLKLTAGVLTRAARRGDEQQIERLLLLGADPNSDDVKVPPVVAEKEAQWDDVVLLCFGVNLDMSFRENGRLPPAVALMFDHLQVL